MPAELRERIAAAQRVVARIDREIDRANAYESYARQLLDEMRLGVAGFADAVDAIATGELAFASGRTEADLSAPAMGLWCLFGWARDVLNATPTDAGDFVRWCKHVRGLTDERRRELLGPSGYFDDPTDDRGHLACRLIQVAADLGIYAPGIKRPPGPATFRQVADIGDALCAAALAQLSARTETPAAQQGGSPPAEAGPPLPPPAAATHNEDFTSVDWFGHPYTFGIGQQASAVRVLWREWEKGHGASESSIREEVGSSNDAFRLIHAFRINAKGASRGRKRREGAYHPAWGTMIQRAGPGLYRLVKPE